MNHYTRNWEADLKTCEAASQGPWWEMYGGEPELVGAGKKLIAETKTPVRDGRNADARFIAEAREGWPAALAERQRLEDENAELRRRLDFSQAVRLSQERVHQGQTALNEKMCADVTRLAEDNAELRRRLQVAEAEIDRLREVRPCPHCQGAGIIVDGIRANTQGYHTWTTRQCECRKGATP